MNPFRRNIVLAGLCAGTAPVWAHGDKHAAPSKVVKEQKAWGIAGEARQVRRSVDVRMGDDMRFQPGQLTVKQGETLRLRVHNAGQQMHEYVIGTPAENAKHAE
ncbi:MAG: plastocyanin, partial [Rhodoferax sp.]|nr:plastocyanin [Rhodoferax sp.]